MDHIVAKLRKDYPKLTFVIGDAPCWSPRDKQIFFTLDSEQGLAGLFHELAHALLGHHTYQNDIDLLKKEVEAWEEAGRVAKHYAVSLDWNHIQDCLDTYRDWLHKRSACPVCQMNGLQHDSRHYSCLNCGQEWQVSTSRFCRPYRLSKALKT